MSPDHALRCESAGTRNKNAAVRLGPHTDHRNAHTCHTILTVGRSLYAYGADSPAPGLSDALPGTMDNSRHGDRP